MRRLQLTGLLGTLAVALSGLGVVNETLHAQVAAGAELPRVLSSPDLIYPKIALAARVSGIVRIHVTTDGKRVASIDSEDGPMMLRRSAEESVDAWIFEDHAPTTFTITFEYKMLDVRGCVEAKRAVIRDLPTHIEIDDAPLTCDWERYSRQQKYLREQHAYPVELHVEVDGQEVAGPSKVAIFSDGTKLELPVRDGLFLVPEILKNARSFAFEARIGDETVTIPQISGWAVEQRWTLNLPTKIPPDSEDHYGEIDPKTVCILDFDPLDGDGMGMETHPCRKPATKD